jgi:predicted nucleic acid-binding protein
MLVVSDTSPLSNLALIGRLDLLREQFSEVLMPPAVSHELSALRDLVARLASFLSPERVLMDEREGRLRASAVGIRTIGVLGVLLVGKRNGNVASIKAEMILLRQEAGFFISPDLQTEVLKLAGE